MISYVIRKENSDFNLISIKLINLIILINTTGIKFWFRHRNQILIFYHVTLNYTIDKLYIFSYFILYESQYNWSYSRLTFSILNSQFSQKEFSILWVLSDDADSFITVQIQQKAIRMQILCVVSCILSMMYVCLLITNVP